MPPLRFFGKFCIMTSVAGCVMRSHNSLPCTKSSQAVLLSCTKECFEHDEQCEQTLLLQ